jgi:hypothetical protein
MNKAKLIKFTYTKGNGEVSERKAITIGLSAPDLLLVFDTTNENDATIEALIEELEMARREYLDTVEDLQTEFGVQMKTFKPSCMTNKIEVTK